MTLQRRQFLTTIGVGAGAVSIAKPAIAQSMPNIKWRLTATWPKSLDTLYGACEVFAKRIAEITDNRFQIQVFAAGEIVPALAVLDAVQNQTIEMGHTATGYWWGKETALMFPTGLPFGLNARQMESWLVHGGGNDLVQEVLASFNCYGIPMGNSGAKMGGWFRKEINKVEDLRGLKFRIAGIAGKIISKIGVVPQGIAAGDIYPALEKGAIDGADWIGPYDDEKLGFWKIAKYYYYPAWWAGSINFHTLINLDRWNSLPKHYQAAVLAAARDAGDWMMTKYDAVNPPALKRLLAGGTQLRPFSPDTMEPAIKRQTRSMRRRRRPTPVSRRSTTATSRSAATAICGGRWPRCHSTCSRCACAPRGSRRNLGSSAQPASPTSRRAPNALPYRRNGRVIFAEARNNAEAKDFVSFLMQEEILTFPGRQRRPTGAIIKHSISGHFLRMSREVGVRLNERSPTCDQSSSPRPEPQPYSQRQR